jgi:asparagine synthase (glutamine-hydrolysing)
MKLGHAISIVREQGLRWICFRLKYAGRQKLGFVQRRLPCCSWESRPLSSWLAPDVPSSPELYADSRRAHAPVFFFGNLRGCFSEVQRSHFAVPEVERILAGSWPYFGSREFEVGFPPDWHLNPATGRRLDPNRHWTQIDEFADGDIKFVWEANRFGVTYALVRAHAATADERCAAAFWHLVEDWTTHNPPQTGANWKCGQEAAFRLMAWCFGLYAFAGSACSSDARQAQLTAIIAAHAERIEGNIDYALSQNNNHGLSEAAGLWTVGLLFPELARATHWRRLGKELLEERIERQIAADGSYVQHSTNYHRLMLHVLIWAFRLGELNGDRFSPGAYDRLARAVDFLAAITDPLTGAAPNYGSNDGALLLPLNNCDFSDYRPVLQAANYLLHRRRKYPAGPWDEDLLWLFGADVLESAPSAPARTGTVFANGGYYVLRGPESWGMVRCARYRSRPVHADQLHLDLWWKGVNVAADAGTYLYGEVPGEPDSGSLGRNALAQTAVHNTITVDGRDQMTRVSRFLWTDWAQGTTLPHDPDGESSHWEGEHNGYRRLGVTHRRAVFNVGEAWVVVDDVLGTGRHVARLHWLLPDLSHTIQDLLVRLQTPAGNYAVQAFCSGEAALSLARAGQIIAGGAAADPVRGWVSRHYGHKEPALSLALSAKGLLPLRFVTVLSPACAEPHTLAVNEVILRNQQDVTLIPLAPMGETPVFNVALTRVLQRRFARWSEK